jgi:hypothetical protein
VQSLPRILLLPMLDAIALGSIAGAHILSLSAHGSSAGVYHNARTFLAVAALVALAVFVVETVLHFLARALANRSGVRFDFQVPPLQRRARRQRIGQILILPMVDSIVLGLIVGTFIFDIYIKHNPMNLYDFGTGKLNLDHFASMFAVFSIPVILIVLVVELVVHQVVGTVQRRRSPRLNG